MPYTDDYNRSIDYLRISITDRCNLRCTYCMPPQGVPPRSHDEILRYEEIVTIVRAAAELDIHKIRLTGGEPLVRLGVVDLVRMLAGILGIDDLSMTTNGILLPRYAPALAQAGLQRVNVSLDTLRPERFAAITRCGRIEDTLAGIQAARQAGLTPVKINTVVIRGTNDDEVVDMARKTLTESWHVRFIEWMPLGDGTVADENWAERVVTTADIRAQIEAALAPLEPVYGPAGGGPARYYHLPGAAGTVGFISPVSNHFCAHCNRLRLTADGQLRPCLLSDQEIDLRTPLRRGAGVPEIRALLLQAIALKPEKHHLDACQRTQKRLMAQIGG